MLSTSCCVVVDSILLSSVSDVMLSSNEQYGSTAAQQVLAVGGRVVKGFTVGGPEVTLLTVGGRVVTGFTVGGLSVRGHVVGRPVVTGLSVGGPEVT